MRIPCAFLSLVFLGLATLTIPPAVAEDASTPELMTPGPLPELAIGSPKAPITVIEYASLSCPPCGAFHRTVFPRFKKRYIDTGKVYFILREFPHDSIATTATVLARCASAKRFLPIVDTLFKKQDEWVWVRDQTAALGRVFQQLGYNEAMLKRCVSDQKLVDGVNAVFTRAQDKLGVTGVPAFFINGRKVEGVMSFEEFEAELAAPAEGPRSAAQQQ